MALTKVSGSVLKNPLSLSGNVSVGGTLTYEDVTNVDSVGLITARSGINISDTTQSSSTTTGALRVAGGVGIVKNLHVGGTITGNGSGLTGVSGVSVANQADNRLITATGTTDALNGESTLTYNGSGTLEINDSGSSYTLKGSSAKHEIGASASDNDLVIQNNKNTVNATSNIIFKGSGSGGESVKERLRITSDGKIGMGLVSTSASNTCDPDGNQLLIRGASTFQTNKGHIMLTGDSSTVGQGPQIVFSESGSGANWAGAYIGHVRQGGGSLGDLVFGTRGVTGDANTVPTERLRITSTGQLVVGTNPTVSSGNIVHIEAPTSFNSGETIVNIEGNNSSAAARLILHNNNTGANAHNEILGVDAGGQSTSSIRFYNTDQSNNYGEIAFGTRNQSGVPPEDRMRIKRNGNIGIGDDDPQTKLHIAGSLCGGTSNQPFLRFFDSSDRQRNTKHYFKCVKGSTSIFDILTVDLNQNFHQALIILYYGARIQNGWDSTTFPVHKIIGVNRFNGGSIQFTKNTIVQDSTVGTHANIDAVATSSTNYRIRLTWSGTAGGSSFACGSVEIIGVGSGDDGAFYSLAHAHGLLA